MKLRLLLDGTHGVPVNERVGVRGRDRMSARDIKNVLRCVGHTDSMGIIDGLWKRRRMH